MEGNMSCCENDALDANRFLAKIDSCFNHNDLSGAKACIKTWEQEARKASDDKLLLTVLNEAMGLYRRTGKKAKAISVMEECMTLLDKLNLSNTFSGATIYVNAATTLSFCDRENEAVALYEKTENIFKANGRTSTYEYASLLNNKAGTLNVLKRYDEAERDYLSAIDILKEIGMHDGEIAISLVMLAHITFDRVDEPDEKVYEKVENLLDEAIKYVKSDNQPKDGNFAYVLKKIAPSFDYFKRPLQAKAMREKAKEIYRSA